MRNFLAATLFCLLSLFAQLAAAFSVAPYLPLSDGNTWSYRLTESNGRVSTETVAVQAGTVTYNGVATKALRWNDGYVEYYSNDSQGIRVHAGFDPSSNQTMVFNGTGAILAPADITIGQTIASSGTVTIPGQTGTSLSYSTTANILGLESVTVPAGTFNALKMQFEVTVGGTISGQPFSVSSGTTYWVVPNIGPVKEVSRDSDGKIDTSELVSSNLVGGQSAGGAFLSSAVIPSGSAIQLGSTTQTWGAIINSGSQTAFNCKVSLATPVPVTLGYRPVSGAVQNPSFTRPINTPIDVPAGGVQVFLVTMTPTQAMAPTDVAFNFSCDNAAAAKIVPTLNTFILSASATPVPNVLALVGTTQDGNPNEDAMVDMYGGSGQFVVATSNIGSGGTVTVSGQLYSGFAGPAPALTVCQVAPGSTNCIAPPAPSVAVTLTGADQPAFMFFVAASGDVPDSPETNRILVRFKDSNGVVRGGTQTAIRSR